MHFDGETPACRHGSAHSILEIVWFTDRQLVTLSTDFATTTHDPGRGSKLTHMIPSTSLPDFLLRGAHPRRRLLEAGVTADDLAGPLWEQTNRGLWAWAVNEGGPDERVRRAAAIVPQGAVSGWAAARIWGAHDLDGEQADGKPLPVPLTIPPGLVCRRRRGVTVLRSKCAPDDLTECAGIVVTAPLRTAFDLARLARDVPEGVVSVDALLRAVEIDPQALDEYVLRHGRFRGVPRAREVIRLVDKRSKSCPETRMRLLWVLDAGLPPPLVNVRVTHDDGYLLAEVDLLGAEAGLVGEYDGWHHASAERRAADSQRQEAMEAAGLLTIRLTAPDLTRHRRRSIYRLRRLHGQGLARDRSRDRWAVLP